MTVLGAALAAIPTATAQAEQPVRSVPTEPDSLIRGVPDPALPRESTGGESAPGPVERAVPEKPGDGGEVSASSLGIVVTAVGFSPEAKAALDYAADQWSQYLVSSVPIEIYAEFAPLDPDPYVLGKVATTFTANPCGSLQASTDYPAALADAICGTDRDPMLYDGGIFVNSETDWYFGTGGTVPSGAFDLVTFAMQSLGTVFGFVGSMDVQGAVGSYASPPTIYDRFATDGAGHKLTDTAYYANSSTQLASALQSWNIYFRGPTTLAFAPIYGAELWAPNPWEPGASFTYLSSLRYSYSFPSSDAEALMTPYLHQGIPVHTVGPVTRALLKDLGWQLPTTPGAPTDVHVVSTGSSEATISFSPPASDGGSRITKYFVTAPFMSDTAGNQSPITITGLTNGQAVSFNVRAANVMGSGPVSAYSETTTPMLRGYHPIAPTRILDTRFGVTGYDARSTPLPPGGIHDVQIVEAGFIDNATSVVMNVTAVSPSAYGWLKVYPTGASPPNASNLNFNAGQTVPNLVTVAIGTDGKVTVANSDGLTGGGNTHVIFDVVGYYTGDGSGAAFTPTTPTRILDTRSGTSAALTRKGALVPQEVLDLPISGLPPISGLATAAVLNVTVVTPSAAGWLTLFPSDQASPPTASNLNYRAGQTVPNLVTVKTGKNGHVKIANTFGSGSAGFTHVIVDVVGWYKPALTGPNKERGLNAATPYRVLDTRVGTGTLDGAAPYGPLTPQQIATVQVAGVGPVPTGAVAAVLNVTVVSPTAAGWLKVFPAYTSPPNASNLNFSAGQVVPNLVVVPLSGSGEISLANTDGSFGAGYTHVIIDVVGWFCGASGYASEAYQAGAIPGQIPIANPRSLVVDAAHNRLFIAGDDAVVVTDLNGSFVDLIGRQPGAWGLLRKGTRLFVARSGSGDIGEIDTATLELGDPVPVTQDPATGSQSEPTTFAEAGGKIWFSAGISSYAHGIGVFDPDAASAVIQTGTGLYRPSLAATANADQFIVYTGTSPAPFSVRDGTTADATILRTESTNPLGEIAVSPSGSILTTGGPGYSVQELGYTSLAATGTTYGSGAYPEAVVSTTANGGWIATGGEYVSTKLFRPGTGTVSPTVTYTIDGYLSRPRTMAFSPDGTKLFAAKSSDGNSPGIVFVWAMP